MKKLFLSIILVFVVITVIAAFFVGDYVSRESEALWDKHKEKPAEVTAQVITEDDKVTEENGASLSEDDKDPQVLRIETLASADKQVNFITTDDASVSTSLETITEIFKRPKSVKPHTGDCGVEDASIVEFNNIQFKKVHMEYFVHSITFAGTNFKLKTQRLVLDKDTQLEDFKKAYFDKAAVIALDKDADTEETASEAAVPAGKKKPVVTPKTTDLIFSASSTSNKEWKLSFNQKGTLQSITLDDGNCKKEEPATASATR